VINRVLLPLLGVLLAVSPLPFSPVPAHAQGLPETDWGEPWNSVGVGVRAIGMGGAFTAVSDDLSGAYWNPGGLVRMKDTQFAVMSGSPYVARFPKTLAGSPGDMSRQILKNFGSIGFVTTKWKPWAAGWTMVRAFHPESLVPWQENYQQGTFVLPLNTARTAGLGINVKFMSSDVEYTKTVSDVVYPSDSPFSFKKVGGWAMDVGGVYVIPMPLRDRYRQVNFGIMARNLIGRKTIGNTETEIPREAQMGVAFMFDDLVPRERSLLAIDVHQALMSNLGANSQQLRIGYEQWFFKNFGAVRFGYATPFPTYEAKKVATKYLYQGRPIWVGGLTVMLADLQVDLAVTFPTQKRDLYEVDGLPETPIQYVPPNSDLLPVEKTRFYLQLTYHWRSAAAPPYARVNVEPLVFSPKKGEVAVFNVDYRDELGLESWALEIKNSARVPVRTFSGKGSPPSRLVWDGLDDRFNLAQDDDHTYSLRVRNREGVETVTSPQAFRVFTPEENTNRGDPTLIFRLLDEQAKKDAENKARMNESINKKLQDQKTPMTGGSGAVRGSVEGGGPESPNQWAPGEGPGQVPVLSGTSPSATVSEVGMPYRGVSPDQILRVQVPTTGNANGSQMVLEYSTQRYILKYLVRELKSLTEQSFSTVGATAKSFMVQARYGNHLMVVETPMEVVRALKTGRIDDKQWARQAKFTLDGTVIQPTFE